MSGEAPEVTVVIPVYNEAEILEGSVRQLLAELRDAPFMVLTGPRGTYVP